VNGTGSVKITEQHVRIFTEFFNSVHQMNRLNSGNGCDGMTAERERVYFTITNTQIIRNKNKAKGGLPEEAKAHRTLLCLLSPPSERSEWRR